MQLDWTPVREEFVKWRRHNLTLPIWWRDDDATEPSKKLDRLLWQSEHFGVPIHLAVIPRDASDDLAQLVAERDVLVPVVHGWAHTNHQPLLDRKCEFGDARPVEVRRGEAEQGLSRLNELMGDKLAKMFVPPWNRVPPEFLPELKSLGYSSFSTCNPRAATEAVPGLEQINTHIDPLYWRPAKKMSHPELIIQKTTNLLKQRRQGKIDNTEPLGLLTHHKAHGPRVWDFCRQYWSEILEGPTEVYRAA